MSTLKELEDQLSTLELDQLDFDEDDEPEEYNKIQKKIDKIQNKIKKFTEPKKRSPKKRSPPFAIIGDNKDFYLSGIFQALTLKKDDQYVLLLGEYHGDHDCDEKQVNEITKRGQRVLDITAYIESLDHLNSNIDLYIEAPLFHLQHPRLQKEFSEFNKMDIVSKGKNTVRLDRVRHQLKWCIQNNKEKCPLKNIRVHSTDIRPFLVISKMTRDMKMIYDRKDWDEFKQKHEKLIKILKNIKTCKDYVVFLLQVIYRVHISNVYELKQSLISSKVSNKQLIRSLYAACKYRDSVKWVKEFVEILEQDKPPKEVFFGEVGEQHLSDVYQNQLAILHDVYTFTQMIGPLNGKQQENIIFYGGDAHVHNLVIMLTQSGFKIIQNNSKQIGNQKGRNDCLKMGNPLF